MMNLKLSQKGLLIVALPLLIQIASFVWITSVLNQTEFLAEKEFHSKEVIGHTNWICALASLSLACTAGSVLLGDEDYRKWAQASASKIPEEFTVLKAAVKDQPIEQEHMATLSKMWEQLRDVIGKIEFGRNENGWTSLNTQTRTAIKSLGIALYTERKGLLAAENSRLVIGPESMKSQRGALRLIATVVLALSAAVALALMFFFSKAITSRLKTLIDNTELLAEGKPLKQIMTGHDEIAVLDKSFHAMAHELTEAQSQLKASELKIRAMLDHMPVGVVAVDGAGTTQYANTRALALFSAATPEQLIGVETNSLLSKSWSTIKEGDLSRSMECSAMRFDGKRFPVELAISEFLVDQKPLHLISLVDVTERQKLEQLKQEFISMVSHDLRTPLASMNTFHQLLETHDLGELNEDGTRALVVARRSVTRLMNMVNDLLDFERLDSGNMTLSFGDVRSLNVTMASVESVSGFAHSRNVRLVYEDGDFDLVADGDRLIQVLINLLSNAAKFSPEGGEVKVDVTSDADSVRWSVTDHGVGVLQEQQHTIFEKYKQINSSDAKRTKGFGLGLPICKAIVEQHRGTIGVASVPGEGSTFWFTIPRRRAIT